MPGRTNPFQTSVSGMSDGSDSYRYGFNGKENDFEPKNGQGTQQDYGMRIYDPRLGKFLSEDPLTKSYPELAPYAFAENTPIQAIDLDGEEKYYFQRKIDKETGKTTIVITGKEDIYEKVYSIEFKNGIPVPVYTIVKNPRVEFVENVVVERPLETVYGTTWEKYEEEIAYKTIEDAKNGTNGHYTDNRRLSHYALQGLNNVAQETRENGYYGGTGKGYLPDDALVVRGGTCKPESFEYGSGVKLQKGKLDGVSVNSSGGASVEKLSLTVPHNKVGVTTVEKIRAAGGDVVPSPTKNNPNHATLKGVSSKEASELFKVQSNPKKKK